MSLAIGVFVGKEEILLEFWDTIDDIKALADNHKKSGTKLVTLIRDMKCMDECDKATFSFYSYYPSTYVNCNRCCGTLYYPLLNRQRLYEKLADYYDHPGVEIFEDSELEKKLYSKK
jgi:ribosomal protein S27E